MLFNSLEYLCFFPVVLLVFFCIPRKYRYLWLLGASYYFYMGWNAAYALLLLFSTAVTYFCSLAMHKIRQMDHPNRAGYEIYYIPQLIKLFNQIFSAQG